MMPTQDKISFSEEEIRPSEMMANKQRCVDADREYLLSRKSKWVEVVCPACQSKDSRFYGEKMGFVYVECMQCGTVYTNPRPSQKLLHDFYATSQNYEYWNRYIFPATEDVRRTRIFRPRAERVLEYCRNLGIKSHTLIEVGAGFGIFCEEVSKLSVFERIIALEPTPDLAETCRAKGLEVIELPVEKVGEYEIADVVASFEVIEHLFSPRNFVEQCARLLRPGGLLVLTCPNVRGFDVATLGMLSNTFDHEHVNYFHTESLPALLKRCSFEIIDVRTPGQLDADIVRKHALDGALDLVEQPFLREVLVERWEELGQHFQSFLAANRLSSHMWVVGRKPIADEKRSRWEDFAVDDGFPR